MTTKRQTEFERSGRINITAGSEKELNQRIKDLEDRGWELKQKVEPEQKHFNDFTQGPRNNRTIHRTSPGFVKLRAVMVRKSSVDGNA